MPQEMSTDLPLTPHFIERRKEDEGGKEDNYGYSHVPYLSNQLSELKLLSVWI
jgi:hypothetical protein